MKPRPGQQAWSISEEMGSTPGDRLDMGSEGARGSSNCEVSFPTLGNAGGKACTLHMHPTPLHPCSQPPAQPLLRPGLPGAGCFSPQAPGHKTAILGAQSLPPST